MSAKAKKIPSRDLASHFVPVEAMPWTKTRHAGVETKMLMADAATGVMTVLTKMSPGARLPDHEHVRVEQTYVLEGSLHCGEGVCRAGEFVWRPAGSRHEAWAGPGGCLTLAMFQAPNRFFEAGGKVVDFMGNDWEGAWGALPSRKSEGERRK
jgi:anti-sigma factor ChrR (cupin superfamily)